MELIEYKEMREAIQRARTLAELWMKENENHTISFSTAGETLMHYLDGSDQ